MKIVAVFYEQETEENVHFEKDVVEKYCIPIEEGKISHLYTSMLLNKLNKFNTELSFIMLLPDYYADKIISKWK